MSTYLLDTGLLLGYIRGAGYADYVERKYRLSQPPNVSLVSVVSKGEIYSLAIQLGWGMQRKEALDKLLRRIPAVDINTDRIIYRYAEIDTYSQGKDRSRPLPNGISSRNMGKNDIWIAATGSILNATLITTDNGFDHLNGIFLTVVYIDQKLTATGSGRWTTAPARSFKNSGITVTSCGTTCLRLTASIAQAGATHRQAG